MLSGFPFRMVNELQGAYSQFARLVGGMMQTPHPQAPDLPMAADPRLDLTPYLYRTLEALQKEMSYAGRYRPIDPTDEPSSGSGGSQQLLGTSSTSSVGTAGGSSGVSSGYQLPASSSTGGPQLPIRPYSVRPPIPIGELQGNPWESAFNKVVNLLSSTGTIPVPGSTVSSQTTQYSPANYGQASNGQFTQQSAPQTWQANQDILAQLFPNLLSLSLEQVADLLQWSPEQPVRGKRVRGRSSRNPK
jgi:hypothetical protein